MKDLIKNPNFLMVGAGVMAFILTGVICKMVNKNSTTTQEAKSNIGGCGCGA